MPRYIFISHRGNDKPRIEALLVGLLQAGAHLWIDRPQDFAGRLDAYRDSGQIGSIRYGEVWGNIIDRELPASPLVLAFVSADALASAQVRLEMIKAREHETLVPVYLEPIYGPDLPQAAALLLDPQGLTLFETSPDAREREMKEVIRFAVERLGIGALAEARRNSAALAEAHKRIAAHYFGSEEGVSCEDILLGETLTCRLVPTRPNAPIADCAPLYVGESPLFGGRALARSDLEDVLRQQVDLWRLPSETEIGAVVDPLGVCSAGAPHPFGLSLTDAAAFWARRDGELVVVDRHGVPTGLATGVAFLVYSG